MVGFLLEALFYVLLVSIAIELFCSITFISHN